METIIKITFSLFPLIGLAVLVLLLIEIVKSWRELRSGTGTGDKGEKH